MFEIVMMQLAAFCHFFYAKLYHEVDRKLVDSTLLSLIVLPVQNRDTFNRFSTLLTKAVFQAVCSLQIVGCSELIQGDFGFS